MKKVIKLSLAFLFFFGIMSFSVITTTTEKYLPFQGKLIENGTPVNGQRTFIFLIGNGGISWTETHNNVTITDGLYNVVLGTINPLPDDIFKIQSSHQLEITVDGNPLDVVTIYSPIENDPTVPEYVKQDSIPWDRISEKPILNNSSNGFPIDSFQVGIMDTLSQPNAGQLLGTITHTTQSTWQSFVPTKTGFLTQVKLMFDNVSNSAITLRLREGEGTSSQALESFPFPATDFPYVGTPTFQSFEIEPFDVIAGQTYTFEIEALSGNIEVVTSETTNPYPTGRCDVHPDKDLNFLIWLDIILKPKFIVKPNGDVQVPKGRIMDKTGLVAFPGEIRVFAGKVDKIPEGWLHCNGDEVDKVIYSELHEVVGDIWGGSGDIDKFRLPDLRGAFLRGWDNGSGNDPDASNRYAKFNGPSSSDNVGSYQNNKIQSHNHSINHNHPSVNTNSKGSHAHLLKNDGALITWEPSSQGGDNDGWSNNKIDAASSPSQNSGYPMTSTAGAHTHSVNLPNYAGTSGNSGGSETRPYNASVIYIIKY